MILLYDLGQTPGFGNGTSRQLMSKRVSKKIRKKILSLVHVPVSVPLGRWRRAQYVNNVKNNIKRRPSRHHLATRPLAEKAATSNTASFRT